MLQTVIDLLRKGGEKAYIKRKSQKEILQQNFFVFSQTKLLVVLL